MSTGAREWLVVLADGLDDPDMRPLAIMTFEALYTSTGMIQMGHALLSIDEKTLRALAATIWADLRDRDFRPGELRSRAGTLLMGIASWLPRRAGERALERGNRLLGRRRDGSPKEMVGALPSPEVREEEELGDSLPGLEYTSGYMEGVLRREEIVDLDEDPEEVDEAFDADKFWRNLG